MKSVLIIDNHPVIKLGMKMMLGNSFPEMTVHDVGTFPDGLSFIRENIVDLVILDINIPGGIEAKMVTLIKNILPNASVLIFSGMDEEKYALRYLQAGADGFLPKTSDRDQYEEALIAIVAGGKYITPKIQLQILNRIGQKRTYKKMSSWQGLTNREMEVTALLVEGLWTKEIALRLNLKESTVSTFKKRIFDKIGVSNTIELSQEFNKEQNS